MTWWRHVVENFTEQESVFRIFTALKPFIYHNQVMLGAKTHQHSCTWRVNCFFMFCPAWRKRFVPGCLCTFSFFTHKLIPTVLFISKLKPNFNFSLSLPFLFYFLDVIVSFSHSFSPFSPPPISASALISFSFFFKILPASRFSQYCSPRMCVFLRTLLEKCGNSAGCVYVFWVFFFFFSFTPVYFTPSLRLWE